MPVRLLESDERLSAPPCSAAYPCSSRKRCCGSITVASADETVNARLSNRSAPVTKPPYRRRIMTASAAAGRAPKSHRVTGTDKT
eukprot:2281898-Prymnesium_polylepis.1